MMSIDHPSLISWKNGHKKRIDGDECIDTVRIEGGEGVVERRMNSPPLVP